MKKTLCITTLCAITALFSGCWKKKDKTDTMNSAMSTDAIMSDDKPIKVAALANISPGGNADMIGGMSTGPSGQNKLGDSTNDEPAIAQKAEKAEKEADDADKKAEKAEEEAEKANKKADEADKKADEADKKADDADKKAEKAEEEADDLENEGDEKKK